MKRVGVITFQKLDNYGADLQAFALQAVLRNHGYDAENIDYLFYKHPRFRVTALSRPRHTVSLATRAKAALLPWLRRVRGLFHRRAVGLRRERFEDFETLIRCSREYRTADDLYGDPPRYDVYVAGSDQIWNPRINSNMGPYFLDFVPSGGRCVSYASSFGVDRLPSAAFLSFRRYLSRFSAVGVREQSGLDLVRYMRLECEARCVLDPTLLLSAEEWSRVSRRPEGVPDGKFVLVYDLLPSDELWNLASRWAGRLGARIVRLCRACGLERHSGAVDMETAGPREFLWLFAHAEGVVTNSFHGTAFSLLNRKPFWAVLPEQMKSAGRIESMSAVAGVAERVVKAGDVESVDLDKAVDYARVAEKLGAARRDSVDFLVRAVENRASAPAPAASLWRTPLSSWAVWSRQEGVRDASTSGGAFSLLAEDILRRGGVVFGAVFSTDFKRVVHVRASTEEELRPLRKSKYVESDVRHAIGQCVADLKAGTPVLFSGTPCQVAAVRRAAAGFGEQLTTCDFVCHGTPRAEVFAAYIEELERKYRSRLTRYEFREKGNGWNFPRIAFEFASGKSVRRIPWLDPFFHGFSINAFLREPCYSCPFARMERVGDFTIGDCWRVAASHPQYDDNRGTSLVLVNTEKAAVLWARIREGGGVCGGEYPLAAAQSRNAALLFPSPRPACQKEFLGRFARSRSFGQAARCYFSRRKCLRYWAQYWVRRLGWRYFRGRQ